MTGQTLDLGCMCRARWRRATCAKSLSLARRFPGARDWGGNVKVLAVPRGLNLMRGASACRGAGTGTSRTFPRPRPQGMKDRGAGATRFGTTSTMNGARLAPSGRAVRPGGLRYLTARLEQRKVACHTSRLPARSLSGGSQLAHTPPRGTVQGSRFADPVRKQPDLCQEAWPPLCPSLFVCLCV